jgi:hypothetical protein
MRTVGNPSLVLAGAILTLALLPNPTARAEGSLGAGPSWLPRKRCAALPTCSST